MVNLAPVNLLLVEEERWLNGHEHVHGDEDQPEERKSDHDANKGARADVFLDVHVIEFLVAIWRDSLHILCESLNEEESEDKGVCGGGRSFHYIF